MATWIYSIGDLPWPLETFFWLPSVLHAVPSHQWPTFSALVFGTIKIYTVLILRARTCSSLPDLWVEAMTDFCRTPLKPAVFTGYFLYVVIFVTFKAANRCVTFIRETNLIFFWAKALLLATFKRQSNTLLEPVMLVLVTKNSHQKKLVMTGLLHYSHMPWH